MKRLSFILLFTLIVCVTSAQTTQITRIGLVNASSGSINSALNLIDREYLSADSIVIVGILHKSQESTLSGARRMVEKDSINNVEFRVIEGDIALSELFEENACTPEFRKLFNELDAVIRFGGDDIPAAVYGEKTFITNQVIDKGQNWQLSFLFHLLGGSQNANFKPYLDERPDFPIMGVCLGMQMMNVASGGSLYQDIPYQIYGLTTFEDVQKLGKDNIHKNYWNKIDNENEYSFIHFHAIKLPQGSFLRYNKSITQPVVASVHHQSPKKLGKGFAVAATSMDGKIIEAIQHTCYKNVLGIQFHTDFTSLYDEGNEFRTASDKVETITPQMNEFHALFWKDFSRRIKKN